MVCIAFIRSSSRSSSRSHSPSVGFYSCADDSGDATNETTDNDIINKFS